MQVVINIPEIAYMACKVCKDVEEQETTLFGALCDAVADGTPLPKGHGRLIDADALDVIPIDSTDLPVDGCLSVCYAEDIDNAPTILEAEKGAEK